MDIYDANAAHSVTDDRASNGEEVITRIITDLFSYDDIKRRRIFDHYYFPHATFTSPILRTEGVHNIKQMFPWIKVPLPVTVVLEFKETDKDSGLLKIDMHQEHWTVEAILKAIPFVSFWYDHVVRTMVGKLLSATGEAVYTATETASLLVSRSKEIEEAKKRLESGEYTTIDEQDKKQEQVMMLRIKNCSSSSTAS
ncbi:hypothetical protein [Parasitella parasitica]|uniref:Uncharacterized protein n=1 Tax=Parasitella parasitica TaxID=35722 RepID=A0A0B7MZI5_9FUNG|nr:hypothetical protein [Parasitella parasitica]